MALSMMSPMEQTQYYNTTVKDLTVKSVTEAKEQPKRNNLP